MNSFINRVHYQQGQLDCSWGFDPDAKYCVFILVGSPFWEYNEGPAKCDPSYPQAFTLPWHLDASETKLIVGGIEHTILGLTGNFTYTSIHYRRRWCYAERLLINGQSERGEVPIEVS